MHLYVRRDKWDRNSYFDPKKQHPSQGDDASTETCVRCRTFQASFGVVQFLFCIGRGDYGLDHPRGVSCTYNGTNFLCRTQNRAHLDTGWGTRADCSLCPSCCIRVYVDVTGSGVVMWRVVGALTSKTHKSEGGGVLVGDIGGTVYGL